MIWLIIAGIIGFVALGLAAQCEENWHNNHGDSNFPGVIAFFVVVLFILIVG